MEPGDLPIEGDHLHPQGMIDLRPTHDLVTVPDIIWVDAGLLKLVEQINRILKCHTYESCQNYGEYLRSLGFDHVHESKRDYAYVEFYDLEDAMDFLNEIQIRAGVTNMLYHKIAQEGTPGAWELKARLSNEGHFWVWFPAEDIPAIEEVLGG